MRLTDAEEGAIRKRLNHKLQQKLPHASESSCRRFLEAVLSFDDAAQPLAIELLHENCTPHEVHLALVYCRNTMLTLSRGLSRHERRAYVKRLMVQHDRLMLALMRRMEEEHEQKEGKLRTDLLREGRAHLLSRAQNEWSHEKEILIYNYFRELQISEAQTLLHVGETGFTVRKSIELISVIAASEHGNTAYTRLPYSELAIELKVEEVTGKTVHLNYGEFTPAIREKRRQMRVQSSRPFGIDVRNTAFRKWPGKVYDFSVSGFGLVFKCETELQPGDAVAFSTMLNGHRLAGRGVVAWVKNFVDSCRAGINIEYDAGNHLRLQNEVHQREKQILGEVKMRGVPDSFLV